MLHKILNTLINFQSRLDIYFLYLLGNYNWKLYKFIQNVIYFNKIIKDYIFNPLKTSILVNIRRLKLIAKFNSDIFGTVFMIVVLFLFANYLLIHGVFISNNIGLIIIGCMLYIPVIVLIHWLYNVDVPVYIRNLERYNTMFYVDSKVFTTEEYLIKKAHRLSSNHYINKCLDNGGGTATGME
jgi:hypothetical protein